jgi:hypothetical protein
VRGIYHLFNDTHENDRQNRCFGAAWQNVNENMIRDKKGFVGYMFPKRVALGIITIICGIADYVNDIMGASNVINFVIMIIFLALLTVYCLCAKKAKKLFVD